jgi:hypothetical protein
MPPENYWSSSNDGTYRYEYKEGSYRRLNAKDQVQKIELDRLLLALSYIYDYEPRKPKK